MENSENNTEEVKIEEPTEEEVKEDEAAMKEVTEEDVRAGVIESYGLDATDDEDLITKLTTDRITSGKKLSKAIGQKIKHRDIAKGSIKKPEEKPTETTTETKTEETTLTPAEQSQATFDKRDMEDAKLPEEIQTEVKNYAKLHKISVREALGSTYITHLKAENEKKENETGGSAPRSTTTPPSQREFSEAKPSDFDVTTPEGLKAWESYKKFLKTQQ